MKQYLHTVILIAIFATTTTSAILQWVSLRAAHLGKTWDYETFKFRGSWSETAILYTDMKPDMNGKPTFSNSNGDDNLDLSSVLKQIGSDGWELAGFDGVNYIVKRPEGAWRHDAFSIIPKQPQDSK